MDAPVQTGLERLLAESANQRFRGQRLGLLCNAASVNRHYRHARELIDARFPGQLAAVFSPQHGFFAEKQDNMVESDHGIDPILGIPLYSLYSATRRPTREMFDAIDTLIVDLQEAGARVYTFIYTLSYCMEAARDYGKKVVVLDRPNPVNGLSVEGNCLADDCVSFVGRYPLPMRHGMTIAELALLFNKQFGIGCDLEVIRMHNWSRDMFFADTGLPWVAPSPNLPTPVSAAVYPGQVLWEGTNVSEGRGTTQPFELFGAPYLDLGRLTAALAETPLPGIVLRPTWFEPTAGKWAGQACRGFQLHVIDARRYQPYATSLKLLQAIIAVHPRDFAWKPPPYEYEFRRMPIDLIIGDRSVRERLERLEPLSEIAADWQIQLDGFKQQRRRCCLYPGGSAPEPMA
jgi:uncharacterized protein YbbC (DUF1343 family)